MEINRYLHQNIDNPYEVESLIIEMITIFGKEALYTWIDELAD